MEKTVLSVETTRYFLQAPDPNKQPDPPLKRDSAPDIFSHHQVQFQGTPQLCISCSWDLTNLGHPVRDNTICQRNDRGPHCHTLLITRPLVTSGCHRAQAMYSIFYLHPTDWQRLRSEPSAFANHHHCRNDHGFFKLKQLFDVVCTITQLCMVNASGLCCQKASPTFRLASRHSFRYAFALPARISQSKYPKRSTNRLNSTNRQYPNISKYHQISNTQIMAQISSKYHRIQSNIPTDCCFVLKSSPSGWYTPHWSSGSWHQTLSDGPGCGELWQAYHGGYLVMTLLGGHRWSIILMEVMYQLSIANGCNQIE